MFGTGNGPLSEAPRALRGDARPGRPARRHLLTAAIGLLAAGVGCQARPSSESPDAKAASVEAWTPVAQTMALATAEDSTAAQLTSNGNQVVVSWIDRSSELPTVRFAEWQGTGWSSPRTVVASDGLFINSADVPSVMRVDGSTLAAQWLRDTNPEAEAYDLLVSTSRDQGETWSAPAPVHHDGTESQHGFASFFVAPGSAWGLVWLDGRRIDAHAGHETSTARSAARSVAEASAATRDDEGAMDLMSATFDASGRQLTEERVDARVCDCCPTSVAVTSSGPLVAFRDRTTDEVRDIGVANLDAGHWSVPRTVHADNWRISACPVNGPAVSAVGDSVAVAWFTAAGGRGRVQAAFSRDAGRTFDAPLLVADQLVRGRVDVVLLPDGSAVVSWVEVGSGTSQLKLRRVSPRGAQSPVATIAGDQGELLGYPKMERSGPALILAWAENQGFSRVVTATIALGDEATAP